MRRLIRQNGPCPLEADRLRSPFEALVRAVAHQQLNGTAAESILKRLRAHFPRQRFPRAADLAQLSDEQMRAVGFSRAKIASIRDIAARTLDGTIPTRRAIQELDDEEIIERLTEARGVGRWTVEMLLIFMLARPDVLPIDDFGIRNGFRVAFDLPEMPKPKEVLAYGERWRPFATVASWHLWRAADAAQKRGAIKGVNA